ncbi:hypothetical protein E5288_WYG003587 [Bos mutus]|uniref:ADAM cysteine-rich domain-containing protein n=1 Tax=Bos mutus TaxID=72004 RepID=A0A6B0RZ32_9CETA|nr:hypothetical protein [Bos mutus]
MESPVLKRVAAVMGPSLTAVCTAEKYLEETLFRVVMTEDVKCGRLQGSNVTQLPPLQEEVSFHQPKISGVWCWGLSNHHRLDVIIDVGQLSDCPDGRAPARLIGQMDQLTRKDHRIRRSGPALPHSSKPVSKPLDLQG